VGYVLAVLAGVALGAAGRGWIEDREPEALQARVGEPPAKLSAAKTELPKRKKVHSRSQHLTFQQLQALGYVDGIYDPDSHLADVVVNETKKTSPGYNFYSSRKQAGAQLIDMKGREVHQWETVDEGAWQHVELLPNGDVVTIVKDERLSRYDKDSNRLWTVEGRFHHDLWIHGDEIYVLARRARTIPYVHPWVPTLVDVIQVRSMDGELKREISILKAIHESDYGFLLPSIAHEKGAKKGTHLDVLHTNHVEVFDGELADRNPIYAAGNILISMRQINAIAILDGSSSEIVWVWGPTNVTFQHHPTLLDNGHILLFDNGLKRSRVLEIDPLSGRVTWDYSPKSGFFSASRGSNQRLANGNTLITESDRGYVLEVTPRGRTVWKFANPRIDEKKEREAIWRMTRFDPATLTFLN
jgi:hypothetical protein